MSEARQVRISMQVYRLIEKESRGLFDTADEVLRRKYGLPPKRVHPKPKKTKPKKA